MGAGPGRLPNDMQDHAGKGRIALVPVRLPVAGNAVNFHVAGTRPVRGRIAEPRRGNRGRRRGSKSRDGARARAGRRGFANPRAAAADAARCFAAGVPGDGRRRARPGKGALHFAPASGRRNRSEFAGTPVSSPAAGGESQGQSRVSAIARCAGLGWWGRGPRCGPRAARRGLRALTLSDAGLPERSGGGVLRETKFSCQLGGGVGLSSAWLFRDGPVARTGHRTRKPSAHDRRHHD